MSVISPNSFIYYDHFINDDDLVIVVSQSGCSTNAIAALDYVKQRQLLAIGLTGNIHSDFEKHADIVIDYKVGIETIGYVTKGVVTLVLFLMLFALEASYQNLMISKNQYQKIIDELKEVPSRHQFVQEKTWEFYKQNKQSLDSMSIIYTCGFIQGYGIALEGALKMGETIKIPSIAYEAEEFIHGPNLQLTPEYTVFLVDDMLEGRQRIVDIYQATKCMSDHVFMITNNKDIEDQYALRLPFDIIEPLLMPLYTMPFFQIIAYQVTNDLNKWNKHPLYVEFQKKVQSKTEMIKKVMPNRR